MNLSGAIVPAVVLACTAAAFGAPLQVLPDRHPQCEFGATAQKISVTWKNPGDARARADIRVRLLQASSATVMPIGEIPWKRLEVLPGQTILESVPLDFPAVNAETTFLIQWLTETNRVTGETQVLVYPTNLLGELKVIASEGDLGVLDPSGELKPLLKQNDVPFLDLGEMSLADFSGKLAIIGPFRSKAQVREGLAWTLRRMARKGTAVVWIQPPPDPGADIKPSYYTVPEGKGSVVIVQPDLVADFSSNPKSQLNLNYLCKLALKPSPPALPGLAPDE